MFSSVSRYSSSRRISIARSRVPSAIRYFKATRVRSKSFPLTFPKQRRATGRTLHFYIARTKLYGFRTQRARSSGEAPYPLPKSASADSECSARAENPFIKNLSATGNVVSTTRGALRRLLMPGVYLLAQQSGAHMHFGGRPGVTSFMEHHVRHSRCVSGARNYIYIRAVEISFFACSMLNTLSDYVSSML